MTTWTACSGAVGRLASYVQRTLDDDGIAGIIQSWHLYHGHHCRSRKLMRGEAHQL
jgi:hypothetical protein